MISARSNFCSVNEQFPFLLFVIQASHIGGEAIYRIFVSSLSDLINIILDILASVYKMKSHLLSLLFPLCSLFLPI